MASRVNAASQPHTTAAQATPAASVRPRPVTSAAPHVTTSAAASTARLGRIRSASGPSTASSGGTQATATPSTAGSACPDPWTRAMLNSTSPVSATPHSQSQSVPRGMASRWPATRANSTSSRQAAAYRTASAVSIGAVASTPEMATLPPTMAMAATPIATAPAVTGVARPAAGAAGGWATRWSRVEVASSGTTATLEPEWSA